MTAFNNYFTGTVSVNNGGTVVTGVGTFWNSTNNVRPGDLIQIGSTLCFISDVTGPGTIVIPAFAGVTVAGVAYTIFQVSPLRFVQGQAMADISAFVAATQTDGWIVYVTPIQLVPNPSYGKDGQWAWQYTTGTWWLKAAGVWGISGPPTAGGSMRPIVVFDGDSMMVNSIVDPLSVDTIFKKICAPFGDAVFYNFAHGGDKIQDTITKFSATGGPGTIPIAAGRIAIYIESCGTNNTVDGSGDSALTNYNRKKSLWALAYAAGYTHVISHSLPVRGDGADATNDLRIQINTLLYSVPSLVNGIVPLHAILTDPSDLSMYDSGGVHHTTNGYTVWAKALCDTILGVSRLKFKASDNLAFNSSGAINQLNGTTAITANGYIYDGCELYFNTSGSMAVSAKWNTATPPLNRKGYSELTVTATQAVIGSTDFLCLRFPVEADRIKSLRNGKRSARPFSITFPTNWPVGNYSGVVYNPAFSRSYPFQFAQTTSGVWQDNYIENIPGEPTGFWPVDSSRGMNIIVTIAAGNSLLGILNQWQSASLYGATGFQRNGVAALDTFKTGIATIVDGIYAPNGQELSGPMLRTDLEELKIAKRYVRSNFTNGVLPANAFQTNNFIAIAILSNDVTSDRIQFSEPMASIPTVTLFSSLNGGPPTAGQFQALIGGVWINGTGSQAVHKTIDGFAVDFTATLAVNSSCLIAGNWIAKSLI